MYLLIYRYFLNDERRQRFYKCVSFGELEKTTESDTREESVWVWVRNTTKQKISLLASTLSCGCRLPLFFYFSGKVKLLMSFPFLSHKGTVSTESCVALWVLKTKVCPYICIVCPDKSVSHAFCLLLVMRGKEIWQNGKWRITDCEHFEQERRERESHFLWIVVLLHACFLGYILHAPLSP